MSEQKSIDLEKATQKQMSVLREIAKAGTGGIAYGQLKGKASVSDPTLQDYLERWHNGGYIEKGWDGKYRAASTAPTPLLIREIVEHLTDPETKTHRKDSEWLLSVRPDNPKDEQQLAVLRNLLTDKGLDSVAQMIGDEALRIMGGTWEAFTLTMYEKDRPKVFELARQFEDELDKTAELVSDRIKRYLSPQKQRGERGGAIAPALFFRYKKIAKESMKDVDFVDWFMDRLRELIAEVEKKMVEPEHATDKRIKFLSDMKKALASQERKLKKHPGKGNYLEILGKMENLPKMTIVLPISGFQDPEHTAAMNRLSLWDALSPVNSDIEEERKAYEKAKTPDELDAAMGRFAKQYHEWLQLVPSVKGSEQSEDLGNRRQDEQGD